MAGLTVLALGLRLALADQSLGSDELFTYGYTVDQSLPHVLAADNENNPPLYYLLAWLAANAGTSPFWIRLPSVLFGAATVPVVYALGTRTLGRAAGLVGAAIVAIAPFGLFYGTEARAYSALMFFTAVSTLALVVALRSRERLPWAVYVIASCATLYTHYLGGLVLAAQVGWALAVYRDQVRRLLLANAIVAVGCIPLLPSLLGGRSLPAPGRAPSLETVWTQSLRVFPGHPLLPTAELPGLLAMLGVGAALALGVVGLALRRPRPRQHSDHGGLLIGVIVAVSFTGFLLYAIAGDAYFLARYLGVALPAVALLVGALVTSGPPRLAIAAASLVLVAVGIGTISTFRDGSRRPDFKDAAELVKARARAGDLVVDPEVSRTITYRAFLPVLGTARQTKFSVHLDGARMLVASTLLDAVSRARPGRRIFVVESSRLVEPAAGLPVRPTGQVTFDGVEPVRVVTYERVRAAPAHGGGAAMQLPVQAVVAQTRACLRRASLDAHFADSPPGAVTLRYPIPGRGAGVVIVFASADGAQAALDGVQAILAAHGGQAWVRRRVIVGFTERARPQDRRALTPCV